MATPQVGEIRKMGVDIVEIMEVQPRACVVVEGDFYVGRVAVNQLGPPLTDDELRAMGYELAEPSQIRPNEALGRLTPGGGEDDTAERDADGFKTDAELDADIEDYKADDADATPEAVARLAAAPSDPGALLADLADLEAPTPTGALPAAAPNPNEATTRPVRLPNATPVDNNSMGRTVENPTSSRHAPAPTPPPVLGAAGGQNTTSPTDRADGPRMTVTNPTSSNRTTVANGAPNGQAATAVGPRKTQAEATAPVNRSDDGPTSEATAPARRPDD